METPENSAALLNEIYNSTYDYAILTFDLDGNITTWNVGAERIMGFSGSEVIDRSNALIFTPEDLARNEPQEEMDIARTKGRAEDYRWHVRKDGSRFWADGVLTVIRDTNGKQIGYLKILRDITERKIAEAEMYRAANNDRLTGLANRYSFEVHSDELIAMASRSGQRMALHLIDLDRFKQVNDGFGHHTGDLLLQRAAQRMRDLLRHSDFIARLGGDEFVVLQPAMPSMQAGAELAIKIIRALSRPFDMEGHEVQIGASIGIAICPHDAASLDDLLKKADLALYRAKEEGKGRYHYFTERLDSDAHERTLALADLRRAVENRDFWIEYQPKVGFPNGQTVGIEALLRCSHPAFSGYRIDDIINLAIDAGLMKNISYWVLRETCSQMRKWKDGGLAGARLCVNLCSQDLTDSETPEYIDALVAEFALQHSDLEIELTERQALEVEQHGMPVLTGLRARGINIALDDFGTGYSALSHLRNLPVTAVKLDKSFLVGVPHDAIGCAVVKAVMDLSHALGLEIIAEGVETEEQAAFLKENHCNALQGFLISHSLPASAMTQWLSAGSEVIH